MGIKIVARNKRARFDNEIVETFEAGLVLRGTEIKSLREGRVSMNEAWVRIDEGGREAHLENMTIPRYSHGNVHNHEERRRRKVLLHRGELARAARAVKAEGLSMIPLSLYLKGSLAKVELALARRRKKHDKRREIARREAERDVARRIGRRR